MKKNTKKTFILILIILIIGSLIGYLIITLNKPKENVENKVEEKEIEEKNNIEEPKEINNEVESSLKAEIIDIEKVCGEAKKGKICIRKVTIAGHEEELRIVPKENDVEPDRYHYKDIALNGINIYEEESGEIAKITIIDDIFILDIYCTNCGGNSATIPTTKIINVDGESIYDLSDLQFEKGYDYDGYTVKDNEIIIKTSRVGFADDYMPSYDCYFKDLDTGIKGIANSNVVNGTNYDKFKDTIAKIDYRLPYLGKNKFSSLVKDKEYKFKDLYTKTHCINEYNEYLKVKDNY